MENKPSELKIGDYLGLGYDSCFIYDKLIRIIGFETKKPGATSGSVEKFLQKNFDLPNFSLSFVVLPYEYKRFINSPTYSRLELDLAIPDSDIGILKPNEKNASNIMDVIEALKSYSVKMIFSNGRSRSRELDARNLKSLVNFFFKKRSVVKNIRVTGVDESGDSEIFDLISNRLITEVKVSKTRTIGNFQIKDKYNQLEGDFLKYRGQLELLQKYK